MVLPHCCLKLSPGHGAFIKLVNKFHKLQPSEGKNVKLGHRIKNSAMFQTCKISQ
jgi:hypothetical protein